MTRKLTREISEALNAARHLIDNGVPIFIAKPSKKAGRWNPSAGTGGYVLPKGWQHKEADPRVIQDWIEKYDRGDDYAVCAVMGHVVDGFDIDPRNGGKASVKALDKSGGFPKSYGKARTPNGGVHHLIASLGVRSRDGVWPGIDVKAGLAETGEGHGFIFLAPTKKLMKDGKTIGSYAWEKAPDIEALALVGGDDSGGAVISRIAELQNPSWEGESWEGDDYDGLPDALRKMADQALNDDIVYWTDRLTEAVNWPEGYRDEKGNGWESLARDWAWVVALWAAKPWSGLTAQRGANLYKRVLPDEMARDDKCSGKYTRSVVSKARKQPVEPPPWDGFDTPLGEDLEGEVVQRRRVNVSDPAVAQDWLIGEAGTRGLSSLFRRGKEVVHTYRMGESGYVERTKKIGENETEDDGPAQVWPLNAVALAAQIDGKYSAYRDVLSTNGKKIGEAGGLFPRDVCERALTRAFEMPHIRDLRGVTHTPMISADGGIVDTAGYDEKSGILYLPAEGMDEVKVSEDPDSREIEEAVGLLELMVADFPWATPHDRANFFALMLSPLLRQVVTGETGRSKLGVLHAHQAGSGKSLLGYLLRAVHGGVMRGTPPSSDDELAKMITGILYTTTGPVVQFDNVRHLESPKLDMLMTSETWSDRLLGTPENVTVPNDRLWIATGNNVSLGGDLARRVLWATIDPQIPDPHMRTDFQIPQLKRWITENRAEVLGACLTMIRAWIAAGREPAGDYGSDDFADWLGACQGILETCGVEGVVDHEETQQIRMGEESDEWGELLKSLEDHFGSKSFSAADVLALDDIELPDEVNLSARSLGRFFMNRRGRWFSGRAIMMRGKRNGVSHWEVKSS